MVVFSRRVTQAGAGQIVLGKAQAERGRECTCVYMTARTKTATPHKASWASQSQGAIAQLGERLPCTQEVGGSIPPGSTILDQFTASSPGKVA